MNVIIRRAKPEELRTVQDLNYALFQSDSDKDDLLNLNWPYEDGEDYFRKMISGEKGVCFVAEAEGKVIGYLAGCIKTEASYRPLRYSELENMLVLKDYRSQGIGEKLIKEFLTWSKQQGITRSSVSAYWPNDRAIEFYKKVGFQPFSVTLEARIED